MKHICKIRKLDECEIATIGGFIYTFKGVKFKFSDGKVLSVTDIRKIYDVEYIPIKDLYYYTGLIAGIGTLIKEGFLDSNKTEDSELHKYVEVGQHAYDILHTITDEWTSLLESSGLDEFEGLQHVDILLPYPD